MSRTLEPDRALDLCPRHSTPWLDAMGKMKDGRREAIAAILLARKDDVESGDR